MPVLPDVSDPVAARFVVAGRVQGVNFRWATWREARRLGLVGLVRNRPDGTVLVAAQGDPGAVDRLAAFLQHGPPHAWVTGVERSPLEIDPTWASFEIMG